MVMELMCCGPIVASAKVKCVLSRPSFDHSAREASSTAASTGRIRRMVVTMQVCRRTWGGSGRRGPANVLGPAALTGAHS